MNNGQNDDGITQLKRRHSDISILSTKVNDGYAGGANRGALSAMGDALLFLNPDVELETRCAELLLERLAASNGAVCGPVVIDGAGNPEFGLSVDLLGDPVGLKSPQQPLYLCGCAVAATREVFEALDGFAAPFFMFCEDLDFCWRALLQGYEVATVIEARAIHRGGGSTPGGYVARGRIEVTAFRIALRERNTLATILTCAPAAWLAIVLPIRLVRILVIAAVATIVGRPDLARELFHGVIWFIRRLPEYSRRRGQFGGRPKVRRRVFWDRAVRDVNSLRVILRHLKRFQSRNRATEKAGR